MVTIQKLLINAKRRLSNHSPSLSSVEVGNERFSRELMEHYFAGYVKWTGISWSQFWELGRKEPGEDKPFFMNILAFKLSNYF